MFLADRESKVARALSFFSLRAYFLRKNCAMGGIALSAILAPINTALVAQTASIARPETGVTQQPVQASPELWSGFRGGAACGTSQSDRLPITWDRDRNVVWKVDVPGLGWSSPVAAQGLVVVTTAIGEATPETPAQGVYAGGERRQASAEKQQWCVIAYDGETGEQRWMVVAKEGKPAHNRHVKNSFATETPVTDGERIWAYFGSEGLYCYDVKGALLWSSDLGDFPMRFDWGTASSPALADGRLFIQCDFEGDSFITSLDATTGRELWRKPRDEKSNWSSPYIWRSAQGVQVVTGGSNKARAYNPESGDVLWELDRHSVVYNPTPVQSSSLLLLSSGYLSDNNRPIYAILPTARGDITLQEGAASSASIAWSRKTGGPYVPSPVVWGEYLYVLYDRGFLGCYNVNTGEEVYIKQRLGARGDGFSASPWAYRDRIFCLSEAGDCYVIKAGPQFEVEQVNTLDEFCAASPAMTEGKLYIRTMSSLYCVSEERNERSEK